MSGNSAWYGYTAFAIFTYIGEAVDELRLGFTR